jgi:hypothetical protein
MAGTGVEDNVYSPPEKAGTGTVGYPGVFADLKTDPDTGNLVIDVPDGVNLIING